MADSPQIAETTVLEVPVTIQGSQIVDGTERRELFTEVTKTTLTLDNGAVVSLKAKVLPGQALFLRNELSGREILCTVLEPPPERQAGYADLQFTIHDPEFWSAPAERPAVAGEKSEEQEAIEAAAESLMVAAPAIESTANIESTADPSSPTRAEVPATPREILMPTSEPAPETKTAEALPEPADVAEPNDAKDAEQLAGIVATDAKGMAKRAAAAEGAKQIEQKAASVAPEQGETNSGARRKAKAFSALALRLHGIRNITARKNPIAVGIVVSVLIAAVLGVGWQVKRGSSIHGDHRPPAASAKSRQQAQPAAGQSSQRAASAVATGGPTTGAVSTKAVQVAKNSPATTADVRTAGGSQTVEGSAASVAPETVWQAKHRRPNELNTQRNIPARIVSQPQPSLPSWAKDLEVSDVVELDAVIDEKGNLAQTKLLSGPRVLEHAAEGAVGLWIFEPALSDGKPTATHMVLTVQFQR